MQSKFGLKDFILFAMVAFIGIVAVLSMIQSDRLWKNIEATSGQTTTLSKQVSGIQQSLDTTSDRLAADIKDIQNRLDRGVIAAPGAAPAPGATSPSTSTAAPTPSDDSWAVEGVPIQRFPTAGVWTSPRSKAGFSEGGEFILVFEGQPPNITPYRYADVYGRYVNDEIVQGLGRYNPISLELEGLLAEAWQVDPAGMWARFRIRDRARFSDGEPVTAEDVRWTYHDFLYNMEIQADRFRSVYQATEEIRVISDKVVEFRFKEARFDNLQQAAGMPVLPKHFYSRFTPAQINSSTGLVLGSGPFRLARLDPQDQWAPPQDIVLVRNEAYWAEKPALTGIRYVVVQDSLARLTTFTNGQADMIRPTAQQFDNKRNDPDFDSIGTAREWYNVQGGWSFIAWQTGPRNGKLTPFADKRVRRAMTHLIDRERIRRDISKGLARVASGPFNSATPQSNPEITPWPYDPGLAIKLLEEAGWIDRDKDGVRENAQGQRFTFELTFGQGNDATLQMVTYVKDQMAKVGIVCELKPIDWSILQSILDSRDFDAATFAWSSSAPETDPTQLWSISSIEGTGDNFVQWRNEDVDRLIKQGRQLVNDEARMKVWHQIHTIWHDEQPYTPLTEVPWLRFVSNRTQNMELYPLGMEVEEFFIPMGQQKSQ
jgi:peptide/nickel transport system substrate-binding protein